MSKLVNATQADRQWAYDMLLSAGKISDHHKLPILAGDWDGTDEVQFIARHRLSILAALETPSEAMIEDVQDVLCCGAPSCAKGAIKAIAAHIKEQPQ